MWNLLIEYGKHNSNGSKKWIKKIELNPHRGSLRDSISIDNNYILSLIRVWGAKYCYLEYFINGKEEIQFWQAAHNQNLEKKTKKKFSP